MILGSFGPFVMFFAWNTVVIGITDPDSDGLDDPMAKLRDGGAGPATAAMASTFGLLAVMTSFIGFVFALMSFYTDMLPQREQRDKLLYAAVIVPPTAAAMIDPALFEAAVDFAGTYGVTILFALFPAAMVWSIRYRGFACSWHAVCGAGENGHRPVKQRQSSTDEEGALELLDQHTATTVDSSATSLEVMPEFPATTRKPAQRPKAPKWPSRDKHSQLATTDDHQEDLDRKDDDDDDDDVEDGVGVDVDKEMNMEELLEFETQALDDDVESDDHPDSAPLRQADFSSIAFQPTSSNHNHDAQNGNRPHQKHALGDQQLVPGGKVLIVMLAAIALGVMLQQMIEHS